MALKKLYMNTFIISRHLKTILANSLVLSIFNYSDVIDGSCRTARDSAHIQKVPNSNDHLVFSMRRRIHMYTVLRFLNRRK